MTIEIKPKHKGWKEGVIKEDLNSVGGSSLKKGEIVRYKKRRVYDDDSCWTGQYEYHYTNQQNNILIRDSKLLIK